jgi:hypothetical protein
VLDEVSAAILGGVAAENASLQPRRHNAYREAPPELPASAGRLGYAISYNFSSGPIF